MRLASKIFLVCSLVIIALAGVGVLSLRAVGRLASVNREIATQTLPAMRLSVSLRDSMQGLAQLEVRYLVLRDQRYADEWAERMTRADRGLERLEALAVTPIERDRAADARVALEAYRALVAEEHALSRRGRRAEALALAEGEAREVVERAEASLAGLGEAIDAHAQARQAEAALLEARVWTGVLVALLSSVGMALLATGLLAYSMTRSLSRLSAATEAVAAGSFVEPIVVEGRDEIARLARSFNQMASELARMQETKEELFASVSHELRSPLTSVREAAHLLKDGVPGELNPKQARLVEIVAASSDRLLRLVNRILELSRLRAGALPLRREPVDLARAADRAVEELRPRAEESGVALERERVGADFVVLGDEDRLVEVVVNLVANAVRFTARGGRVVVRLVDAGPEVEIQVEDTGAGIPVEALPHIFEAYRQAHRGGAGTGLGLAIVRGVAEAHGGRVTVESHEGKGSRFTVLLPRRGSAV
jgi:signal transduction histidine kinase